MGRLLGRHIPEPNAPFALHRGKPAAVTAEGDRADNLRLVLQKTGLTAGRGVPAARGTVPCRRCHRIAIRAESDIVDVAFVSAEDAVTFHQADIPDTHRAINGAGHQARAVGREDWRTFA